MPFNNSKLSRDTLLSRFFPQYTVASAGFTGLSGGSCIIAHGEQRLVLRQHHDPDAPRSHFRRQYHALNRLPPSLAPRPRGLFSGWMAVEYLHGETQATLPRSDSLAALLHHLHQQHRFGWRVPILPLLERYWQFCDPARRTPFWLRTLKGLRQQAEPKAIRLAPLHMDIHAGNIVVTGQGLRLIDWEYAGDGDIALELAAVWSENDDQRQQLINEYARLARLDPAQLACHVRRWRRWVLMLMAGWYEYRWQQTGDRQFCTLADDAWRQLKTKGQER